MSQAKGQGLESSSCGAIGALRQRGHWHLMAYENNAWPFSEAERTCSGLELYNRIDFLLQALLIFMTNLLYPVISMHLASLFMLFEDFSSIQPLRLHIQPVRTPHTPFPGNIHF